jgi:ankyrin repeat protein
VTILLQHGADFNCINKNKNSPLHIAALYDNSATVKILLQHGADVNCLYEYGTVNISPMLKQSPMNQSCDNLASEQS